MTATPAILAFADWLTSARTSAARAARLVRLVRWQDRTVRNAAAREAVRRALA